MPLTDNECIKLRSEICRLLTNKDDWNKVFNEKEKLELTMNNSNFLRKGELDKITYQYKQIINILIFEAPHLKLHLVDHENLTTPINISIHSNAFKTIKERVISANEISQKIYEHKPSIVYFCGHGQEDGSFSLGEEIVIPNFFKKVLYHYSDIVKCVIFNTCNSCKAAEQISPHIDYVISMNKSILDEMANKFAKGFGSGLVNGYSDGIDMFLNGFAEGIIALTNDDSSQELIPVLKIRYEQAVLNFIKKKDAERKIGDFLEKIRTHFPSNKIFNEFYHDYSYPIKQDDLNQLGEIIRQIEYQNLVKAYRKTLPENATVDNKKFNYPENIDNIIDILRKDFPEIGSNKVPSILVFATNLAEEFEKKSQEHQRIKSWIEKLSSELSISISVKAKDECSSREFYTYLLIIVNDEGNKFNLRAEYILEDENLTIIQKTPLNLPEQKEQTGITCDSFNDIPRQVQKYYNELFNQQLSNNQLNNIKIELFLPIQYLIKNIDKEWLIDDEISGLTQIVREYNIVLRPSERLKKKEFCVKLQNNFERFNDSLKGYIDEDILNKEIEIIHQKVVDSNFQKISDNFKDKKIGVKLTYNGIPEIAFFRAIIRGAIGIAFWRRCSIPEASNFSDIDHHLNLEFLNNNCRKLIEKMHELRKEASYNDENNDENFYPIGFLCDNPNRIPNLKPLKSF